MYISLSISYTYIDTHTHTRTHIYMYMRRDHCDHCDHCDLRALGRDHQQLRGDVARRERGVARDHHEPVARPGGEGASTR